MARNWTRSDMVADALNVAEDWELRRALFGIVVRLGELGIETLDMADYARDGLVDEPERSGAMCAALGLTSLAIS